MSGLGQVRGWKGDQERESRGMGSSSFCLMWRRQEGVWEMRESSLDPDHGYLDVRARHGVCRKWGISLKDFNQSVSESGT